MKTNKEHSHIFFVLVPHGDVRLVLRKYSDSLFKNGFHGAYSFPWAAPLAALSHPLSEDELKYCARTLREAVINQNLSDEAAETQREGRGIFYADESSFTAFGDGLALFGPCLSGFPPPNSGIYGGITGKVTSFFSPPVIGTCLLPKGLPKGDCHSISPQISFRAAAVANMFWRVNDQGGSFYSKWKIGKLHWLPAVKK